MTKRTAIPRSPLSPRDLEKSMQGPETVTFISPYRQIDPETGRKMPKSKNKRRLQKILRDVHEMGVPQTKIRFLRGRYEEEETGEEVTEAALMVRGLTFDQARELQTEYGQDSIIFKGEDGAVAMYGTDWVEASPSIGGGAYTRPRSEEELFSGSRSHTFNLDFRFGPDSPAVNWDPKKGPVTREQIEEATEAPAKKTGSRLQRRATRSAKIAAARWWREIGVGFTEKPFLWRPLMWRNAQFHPDPEPDPLSYADLPEFDVPEDLVGDDPAAEEAPAPVGQPTPAPDREPPELHKAGVDNVRKIMELATPEEIDYWANWYDVAHGEASELAENLGMPLDVVAGVIAALSPNLKWEVNIDAAENLLLNTPYYEKQVQSRELETQELKEKRQELLAPVLAKQEQEIAEIRDQRTEELNELKAQLGVKRNADLPKRRYDAIMNRASKAMSKVRKRYRPQVEAAAEEVNAEIAEVNAKYPFTGVPSYSSNIKKALSIIETGDPSAGLSGPKVTVFYQSMMDPANTRRDIVLDGHAINIYRGDYNAPLTDMASLSLAERKKIEEAYNQVAREYGLEPQEVQAITWSIWRQLKSGGSSRSAFKLRAMRVVHYSTTKGLTQLDPKHIGSGSLSRSERQDTRVPVTFFYMEGTEPEQLVVQKAKARYEADIPDRLLDLGEGVPDAVRQGFKEDGRGGMYQAIKDMGFFGFYNSASALPNAVLVFYPVKVEATPVSKDNPYATWWQKEQDKLPDAVEAQLRRGRSVQADRDVTQQEAEDLIVGPIEEDLRRDDG